MSKRELGSSTRNDELKKARESRGLTQAELAEKMVKRSNTPGYSVDPVTISRWERGVTIPCLESRRILCEIFGRTAEELGLIRKQTKENSFLVSHPRPPFLLNMLLQHEDEFCGRTSILNELVVRVRNRGSIALLGPRGMGKTWLLRYLLISASRTLGSQFHVAYVNAKAHSCSESVDGFVAAVARELTLPPPQELQGLDYLSMVVEEYHAQGDVLVLCIDDLEGLGNPDIFTLNFFRALRAMNQQFRLVLAVATSRKSLIDAVGEDIKVSGFSNILDVCILKAFRPDEASEFIGVYGNRAGLTTLERERLWLYSKVGTPHNSPKLLQLVGEKIWQAKNMPDYMPTDDAYWAQFEAHLEQIYREVM